MTKGEILAALPKLAKADLAAIIAVAQKLLGDATAPQTGQAVTLEAIIFDALGAALGQPRPYSTLPRDKLAKKLPLLTKELAANFRGWDENKVRQVAFLRMLFLLLKDNLSDIGIQPTYTTMINNLHRTLEVAQSAFPGYLEAGLGPLIVKQFGAGNVSTVDKAAKANSKLAVQTRKTRVGKHASHTNNDS